MATVAEPPVVKADKPANTSQFKIVPESRELRDRIRAEAASVGKGMDRARPLTKPHLRKMAEALLGRLGLGQQYLGFTMVTLSNEFWRDQVSAIDFSRRLLLLPHCLKNAEGCPADYDQFGLDCRKCGACNVADFKVKAEELGYKVLVSEGTPIVLKIIVSGHVDAIVGVACLNVLERALDKILQAGVPSVAVPLLSSNCRSTSVDDDWVGQMIFLRSEPAQAQTRSYVHLLRAAHQLCEEPELSRLAPPRFRQANAGSANGKPPSANGHHHGPQLAHDPLVRHEIIAYDWLGQGGKRSRPFITLAVYDALTGGGGTRSADKLDLPDHVRRTALAIEAFHKASLVHDDIEDGDSFRYGKETLHRQHGINTAINVGDYLVGLGYRLISRQRKELGADCTADILDRLADAHMKLSEGQGAELLWRDAPDKTLTALDALKIYALKTAPAFEAALFAGLRLAGPADQYQKMVVDFSRHVGIAFQILNDLKDWDGDSDNKLLAGQDVLAGRPTLLLALALEGLSGPERDELLTMLNGRTARANGTPDLLRLWRLFDQAQVFAKADKLIDKYRDRAEGVATAVEPAELRDLLLFLVGSVLDRQQRVPEFQLELVQPGLQG